MSASAPEIDFERAEATLLRYAGAGPRYTSYPTAPVWTERYGEADYRDDLARLPEDGDLSVYVHVPFCESLCHFCACNRVITRKEEPPARYLDAIEREIDAVRSAIPGRIGAVQQHWGGGTPTHLTPRQVRRLFDAASGAFPLRENAEISIEVDPRVTTPEHVDVLGECGFNRISLGVQDFDERVQAAIHRVQTVEQTAALVDRVRAGGFRSVAFDMIYGLPFQTVESFERSLDTVTAIGPDRIALYAYAHVTWVAKQQRGFERADLPAPATRLRIFIAAMRKLLAAGYEHVGMDHFARPEDDLTRALHDRTLRRNFMGYTTRAGLDLLGFGPSAISELSASFAQSQRDLTSWHQAVGERGLATMRGCRLSQDDRERRWVIARIMCLGEVRAPEYREAFGEDFATRFAPELERIAELADDGLVDCEADGSLRLEPMGRLVVRNVAMVFDAHLPKQQQAAKPLFSQTV